MINLDLWPLVPDWLSSVLPGRLYRPPTRESASRLFPEQHSAEGIKAWVLRLCSELNITSSSLAKGSGLAASTLNRFLRQPSDDRANLSASTIERIQRYIEKEYLDEYVIDALVDEELRKVVPSKQHDKHVSAYRTKDMPPYPPGPWCFWPRRYFNLEMTLRGKICNYLFKDISSYAEDYDFQLRMPTTEAGNPAPRMAMEVVGSCGEPSYGDGDIVTGVLLGGRPLCPAPEGHVIAFRRGVQDFVECGLWRFVIDPGERAWLLPMDPKSGAEGVFVGHQGVENDRVYISHAIDGHHRAIW